MLLACPGFTSAVRACVSQVRAAKIMGLPVIVTEQYPKGLGHTAQEIAELLPSDALSE